MATHGRRMRTSCAHERTQREARPAVATRAWRVTACQQNHSQWQLEIEGITLLDSMMILYSADTLICCKFLSCRTYCSVCRHCRIVGRVGRILDVY